MVLLTGWLADCWLVGWLAGWLPGCLAGWLAGESRQLASQWFFSGPNLVAAQSGHRDRTSPTPFETGKLKKNTEKVDFRRGGYHIYIYIIYIYIYIHLVFHVSADR